VTSARNLAFTLVAGVLLTFSLVGCGGSGYVPVSGTVALNGKPIRNAKVDFLPMSTTGNQTPGRASVGYTDENGKFTLKTIDGVAGAAVGRHRVKISSNYSKELKGYEVWDAGLNKMVRSATDPVPKEWNSESKQEFEVPSGGTDKANFDIVTSAKKK
jgi:hypothetical protein